MGEDEGARQDKAGSVGERMPARPVKPWNARNP